MTRDDLIVAFLSRNRFAAGDAGPLAQDASFRRYLRIRGPRSAVLMDAPPPEDVRPFLRISAHLRAVGLSAPDVMDADETNGLVLQEDLGDDLLSVLLDGGQAADALLDVAVDALIALQRATPPAGLAVWNAPAMAAAATGTLFDWWWPARFNGPAPQEARADVAAALQSTLDAVALGPLCLVHRDYFAGNLFWLPHRHGPNRVGIIDFQGAALGHPAYDLVSLLQDARRDVPRSAQQRALDRYLAVRKELDPGDFLAAYGACAAQRHLRVACQWVRLALRDARPQYLVYGPRTWRLLEDALRHPVAEPLAGALNRWIPAALRGNPPGLEP